MYGQRIGENISNTGRFEPILGTDYTDYTARSFFQNIFKPCNPWNPCLKYRFSFSYKRISFLYNQGGSYCIILFTLQLITFFMNGCKYRFFIEEKRLLAMRCAVFCHEDGHHSRGVPRLYTTKTVVMAIKTVAEGMKTVVVAIKRQIPI